MRIVLRILAILMGWEIINTILLVHRIWRLGNLAELTSGLLGATAALGWVLTFVIGPFAAVQLWRLRPSGRKTSLLLAAFALLYYIGGWLFFRGPGAAFKSVIVPIIGNSLFLVLLLSPQARRLCREPNVEGNQIQT